jgi:hypothetical protein
MFATVFPFRISAANVSLAFSFALRVTSSLTFLYVFLSTLIFVLRRSLTARDRTPS